MTVVDSVHAPSRALSNVHGSAIRDLLRLTEQSDVLGLVGGLPATELISAERISASAARIGADPRSLQYTDSAGVWCRVAR